MADPSVILLSGLITPSLPLYILIRNLFSCCDPRQLCGEHGILLVIKTQAAAGVSAILKRVNVRLTQKGQASCDNSLLLMIDKVFQLMTESQFFLLC